MRYLGKAVILAVICLVLNLLPNAGLAKKIKWSDAVQRVAEATMAACIDGLEQRHSKKALRARGFANRGLDLTLMHRITVPGTLSPVKVFAVMRHKSTECVFTVENLRIDEHRKAYDVLAKSFKQRGYRKVTAAIYGGRKQDAYQKGATRIRMRYSQGAAILSFQMNLGK